MEPQKPNHELILALDEAYEKQHKALAITRLAEACDPDFEINSPMCHHLQHIYVSIAPESARKEVPGRFSAICDVALLREEHRLSFFGSEGVKEELQKMSKSGFEIFSDNTIADFIDSNSWSLKTLEEVLKECHKQITDLNQQRSQGTSVEEIGKTEILGQSNNSLEEQPTSQLLVQQGGIIASISRFLGRG